MLNGGHEEKLEMFNCFICESRELLDDVEPQIIAMEEKALTAGKIDNDILNAIFRLFHSLKGSASFLDLQTIVSVTHEAETLLDIFRSGVVEVTPGHVDLLIRTTDFVRNILVTVERQLNDLGHEAGAAEIIIDLQKSIASISNRQDQTAGEIEAMEETAAQEDNGDYREPALDYYPPVILDEQSLDITPEMIVRFVEESLDLLDEAENVMLVLEKDPSNIEYAGRAFRALHSFKGNSGFFGYPDLEEISHYAETLLDKIRVRKKDCEPVSVSFLLIAIDTLREGIRQVGTGVTPDLPTKEEVCRYLNKLALGSGDQPGEEAYQENEIKETACTVELQQCETDFSSQVTQGELDSALPNMENVRNNIEKVEQAQETGVAREKQTSSGQQAIRVDLEKLDKLLDLVGEMVISEAIVANNPDLNGLQLDRFEKAVLQLDKITRDIQEVAMSMQMVPLSGTFRKMVRLVRDLAHKANKKVSLEIIGQETEVDKTLIEQISDPLVHLIRNAVDHGLENSDERLASGKPETGRITIEAKHSAGEVWIVVEDDGKGLDREKILLKGVEKGLINADSRELKDEEVWKLVFEPGFSTAEKVSSISGRGVGMDVVKRNIEKLRGKVEVRSKPGEGTMFAVRIPLTLAIIDGMVVKVGQHRYTIPINSIKESLQPASSQITSTPYNLELVNIRGEILPVIRLHELYNVQTDCRDLTGGILIVVEKDEKKYCLLVDEVVGQQQIVIKGLSGYLGHVRSVSGCAILGDGDISMILDIDDLINSVEKKLIS